MNAKELREKTTGELREMIGQLREELFKLKMQHYTGQLEQVAKLKTTKRTVARVLTLLRQREMEKS